VPKVTESNSAELQAMLAPKAPAPGGASRIARPPVEAPAAAPPRAEPAPAPAPAAAAAPRRRAPAAASTRYAVQVGSFSVVENAEAVRRRLAEKGYPAQVIDWTDGNQRAWKVVRVVGYDSQAEARRVVGELKTDFGLTPYVVGVR